MPGRLHDDDVTPFAALRRPAVEALARILYFRHATTGAPAGDAACRGWLRRQKRAVADLRDAPALRRPRALSLLGDLFCACFHHGAAATEGPRALLRAEADAALCPSHRALSPRVLASLAALVEEEARRRLDRASAAARRTREKKKAGAAEGGEEEGEEEMVAMWMESAARVAALWTGRRRWEERMGRSLDLGLPSCVRGGGGGGGGGGCAACRLAVVGGSPQFLTDLRAGLVARHEVAVATGREWRAGTPEPPVLLRMVEAWIDTCYARRRRRRIRRESDWMAALVLRRRLGGGGGGGGREKRSEGGRRRAGCWPARDEEARLMMEVDVEALFPSSDEEDEEGEEYVVGYVQGRWGRRRRATSTKKVAEQEEGCSPRYFPTGTFAAVMRVMPEGRSRSSSSTRLPRSRQRQSAETKASPPSPPPPPPPARSEDSSPSPPAASSPPSSSPRASGSTVVAADSQPRTTAESPTPAPRTTWAAQQPPPPPPLSLAGEAELAAIYDAYYSAAAATGTTTTPTVRAGGGAPSSPCTRSVPRPRTVSPLSEHGCVAAERRDDDDVESLHPRPLRTRHQRPRSSGIPVPKHPTAAGMPRVSSVHSVSSTVLLGCGGRRWPRPVEGC